MKNLLNLIRKLQKKKNLFIINKNSPKSSLKNKRKKRIGNYEQKKVKYK